ncbi:porin [Pandoraea anhela]|uniref:Porin n=1 Tax=Pandoraea anhela TaxID=2508295 RepID=A0A5E4RBV9_9BURK|nr:porin [Pandoraea anhela]VVD59578.1 porin [Pandoraea anhela]
MQSFSRLVLVPVGLLASMTVHAQSSVSLYGVLDAGVAYFRNSGGATPTTLTKFNSGNLSGSRWGIRGTDALGGGLSAVFQLENGFNLGTGTLGQGSREFGRKAVVGLADQRWGTLTIGRQYDPVVDLVQGLTEDAYFGGSFATPGDLDNYDNSLRVSNSIKYVSPLLSGFQFEALYGIGGVAGAGGNGRTISFGGAYANGPFAVGAGYFYANGGNTTNSAGVRTWTGSSDTIFNTAINQGFGSAKSIQIARAAAQYTFGAATFGLAYSNAQYGADAFSAFRSTARFNVGSAFVNYQLSPTLRTGIGYSYTSQSGPASAHYNQINLGADYALSKRTDVYALAGYQIASGNTLSTNGALTSAQASIGSFGVSAGAPRQLLTAVGMRHKF